MLITDALRRQVREELPEFAQAINAELQERGVEAWSCALTNSSFQAIWDILPAGKPDTNEARRGDQTDHLRGVTQQHKQAYQPPRPAGSPRGDNG